MQINNYSFSEPKNINPGFEIEAGGVYIILTYNNVKWTYIYVGQTGDLSQRVENHEKWNCWLRNMQNGGLFISFLPVSRKNERLEIETKLRKSLPGLSCNLQ